MEISTIIGLALGFGAVLFGHIMENGMNFGSLSSLWAPTAFLIVIGGTFGVLFVGYPMHELKNLAVYTKQAFFKNPLEPGPLVAKLVSYAEKARREGLLALQNEAANAGDPFLLKGLTLVTDGLDAHSIKEMMEVELDFLAQRHAAAAGMFDALGGFAPTLGIMGTVMGLISVLGNLSDPSSLGGAIAVAFVATLYGVGTANLLYLPMAQKLKRKSEEEALMREVMIAGILSIQAGDNPQIVEEKLKSFLAPGVRSGIGRNQAAGRGAKEAA